MIRVLHVVTQMNRGGLENRLMDIYRKIDRNVIQFDFYTCRRESGFFDAEILELGGRVFYTDPLRIQDALGIPRRFAHFLSTHREYQIVQCHLNHWSGLVLAGAKAAGVYVRIAHARTALKLSSPKNIVKNVLKLPVNHMANYRFAVSRTAAVWLFGERACLEKQVTIWPNAIDVEAFRFSQSDREIIRNTLNLQSELTIIHVGNIRPEKNHVFLLRLFKEVLRIMPEAKLLIVGQDYMEGQIHRLVQHLGLEDSVIFLGARRNVSQLLCAADMFIFPSLYEGFPGALLEAQASGLPCVVSDAITKEACILPGVVALSLKAPTSSWVDAVLAAKLPFPREDAADRLIEAGYDARGLAMRLSTFYFDALGIRKQK